jgi:hypothetical protein
MKAKYLIAFALVGLALPCSAQMVDMTGRFISTVKPLMFEGKALLGPGAVKILPPGDEGKFLKELKTEPAVLTLPTVTTKVRQQAVIQIVKDFEFRPKLLGDRSLLRPDWKPDLSKTKVDLGTTLTCEAMKVAGDKVEVKWQPAIRKLLGYRERKVPVEALNAPNPLQDIFLAVETPLLRTAEIETWETEALVNMPSDSVAIIYIGSDRTQSAPRWLYMLVRASVNRDVASR